NVVEAARLTGVKRFLYTASSSCYGIPSKEHYPTPEEAPIDTQYPYALTKYLGEQTVLHWGKVYDLQVVSLRLFNVYGPRSRTSGTYGAVFGVFLAQKLKGKPYTVVGDGEQTRDFIFVTDVAKAFYQLAQIIRAEGDIVFRVVQGMLSPPLHVGFCGQGFSRSWTYLHQSQSANLGFCPVIE
ncbi:MAG: NAD-dependent epimerase/dehydratase family protein, partial [Nitrospinae bacterium]|nr:NAD-dependent epimerase/dehydratase family protein [Nitrospinota bacterium]